MLTTTYFNVYQTIPATHMTVSKESRRSLENHHDKFVCYADAEAFMEKKRASWLNYLYQEQAQTDDADLQLHYTTLINETTYDIVAEEVVYTHACNHLWTDVLGYEITKVISDRTIEVRRMRADVIIDDIPQLESDPYGEVLRIRRKRNDPEYWGYKGRRFTLSTRPFAYRDPNF